MIRRKRVNENWEENENKIDEFTAEEDLQNAISSIKRAIETANIVKFQFRRGIGNSRNWNLVETCLENALDELKRVM